jgi:hypothetical protein
MSNNITSASAYRQRRQQGQEWTAPSGAVVLVRSLDLTDHVILNQFPDYLQQTMYHELEASTKLQSTAKDDDADEAEDENAVSFLTNVSGEEIMKRERELGVTICKLGWISPQVVDEVTDPDAQIGVDELDSTDRRAFMAKVFAEYRGEAQQLAGFPAGSGARVEPVQRVPAVQDPPQSAPPAGAAIFRADSV